MTNTSSLAPESLQDQFARRVAARLSEAVAAGTPPDIDTRLRFAREQALQRARAVRQAAESAEPVVALGHGMAGTLRLGRGGGTNWWLRLGSALPLLVLAGGLLLIQEWQSRSQIQAAVEIDTALLSDSVPPDAYADPGFVEFLRTAAE
ncbi:MAG: DUF3619 family protein [Aquincola tertiaricarbonis]|uniref:DUF3619 family protein n=1 Tax=Aquincola tertiaricarbonis TaxID=391953 RepID=UPI000614A5B3|nr:DUF3619 family protein [Aquincola tertiaricarbonis]